MGLTHSAQGLAGMHLYGDQLRRMQCHRTQNILCFSTSQGGLYQYLLRTAPHYLNAWCFFSVNSIHSHLQMLSEFCEDISCPSHVSVYHLMTNLYFLVQKTAPLLNVMWSPFLSFFLGNNDFWEWCFKSETQVTQKKKICILSKRVEPIAWWTHLFEGGLVQTQG